MRTVWISLQGFHSLIGSLHRLPNHWKQRTNCSPISHQQEHKSKLSPPGSNMILTPAARSLILQQSRTTLLKAATARSVSSLASRHFEKTAVRSTNQKPMTASSPLRLPSTQVELTLDNKRRHFSSAVKSDSVFDTSGRDAYNVSQTYTGTDACKKAGLDKLGITGPTTVYRDLTYQEIFDHEVANKEGDVVKAKYGDTFEVRTGKYTGRSPHDKWIVKNPGSETEANIDWGPINQPTTPEVFDELHDRAIDYFNTRDTVYVFDGYCGANPASRKKVRFVFEMAWQMHFVTNMFIRPETKEELENFEPDFTVINCCSLIDEDWERHNLNSETAVVFNVEKEKAVVYGTWYGGENKKGIFSLMNYWLPMKGMFPMHCSANIGKNGDTALFFGLSGTGKTTLSADPHRALIGDDEHGWDDDGIFNFEGGCYAKTINLREESEPDIYRAIRKDALLENVMIKPDGTPDYDDVSITQNGRVSYPIFHIDGYHEPQMGGHPSNIIFLSCDAFGILPPVARLSSGQAMYHFLSGYTAKVAGTERGIKEPVPNFSACFGAAFMTLHPTRYADLLQEKLDKHGSHAYLVNSGWSGGPYGIGKRMSIHTSRACIDAILDGSIHDAEFRTDPVFGFEVPVALPGVEGGVLDPQSTWPDKNMYHEKEKELAQMYIDNFKQYEGVGSVDYTQFGPQI